MVRASLMPVRCWIAPEMPIAMYNSGRDDLAGLSDLHLVRRVAGIHRGARGADRGAELVGEAVEDLEAIRAAERAAAGDHARGGLQVGAVALGGRHRYEARVGGQRDTHRDLLDRAPRRQSAAASKEAARTVPTSFGPAVDFDREDRVAGVDRAAEASGRSRSP